MSRVSVKHSWKVDPYNSDRVERDTCIKTRVNVSNATLIEYVQVLIYKGNFFAIQVCGWTVWRLSEGRIEISHLKPDKLLALAGICWRTDGGPEYTVQRDARKLADVTFSLKK